jgi:DNA uptake protein ComE-like DNA-binding protein
MEKILMKPPAPGTPYVVHGNEERFTQLIREGWWEPTEETVTEPDPPVKPPTEPEETTPDPVAVEDDRINVNTATLSELTSLPSIGITKGNAIIAGRPYTGLPDLIELNLTGVDWLSLHAQITF